MKMRVLKLITIVGALLAAGNAWAQTASPSPTPDTTFGPEFKRWVDVDQLNLLTRYRYIRANNGDTLFNHEQWRVELRTRFKFDKAGRYSVNGTVFTGPAFTSGWNHLGPGTGNVQTNLWVKHLFFDAKPTKKIDVQFGGISINEGENSEVTAFDLDNYITGERVIIRAPKKLFFDEISATNAYLGDTSHPDVFHRLHRLNESNYHQFLVRKQVTKAVGFSTDYTFVSGTDTMHEAVRIKPKHFFLNTLLFDTYQRVDPLPDYGFDIFGEKIINKHITVNGGFARIDDHLILNGDKFPPGKRLYTTTIFKLCPDLTLSPVFVHAVGDLPTPTTHRTRFEIILNWNVLETLHRHHVL
jgi:hypothetical protein